MFKLITVTLAALYAVFFFLGAEERRVEVSRMATSDDTTGYSLAAFKPSDIESTPLPSASFGMSDKEAIEIALKSGAEMRAKRSSAPLYGVVAAVDAAGVEAAAESIVVATEEDRVPMWYVTGSSVNLRNGPGTGNAVVGKVGFGDEAEVLDDKDGWYQIKTADGALSGWIFGKFLADNLPG